MAIVYTILNLFIHQLYLLNTYNVTGTILVVEAASVSKSQYKFLSFWTLYLVGEIED